MTEVLLLESNEVEISTPRLLLRGARSGDGDGMHEAFKDMEVMRYWSTLPHTSIAQSEEWIQKMIQGELNGITDFVICLKPDLKVIGKIGAWQDQEIGFLLARAHWGMGLAQEALGAVIPYFFEKRDFDEITADADPRNAASIGLLQKFGFVVFDFRERTLQVGDEWVDSTYLRLRREEWKGK